MQNIYEGNGLKGVAPGTIKQLRIVEIQFRAAGVGEVNGNDEGGGALASSPVGVGNAAWDVKRVIGVTDVYPDGSAFFKSTCPQTALLPGVGRKGQGSADDAQLVYFAA